MQNLPPAALPEVSINAGGPGTEHCILDARTDRDAIKAWLKRFESSPNTHSSYIKEADRFYRWALLVPEKPVSLISHEDFQAYLNFLTDPQPANFWVSKSKLPRTNPLWRPFFGPLAPASIKQSTLILDTLFSWLVESRYMPANPISLVSKRDKTHSKKKLKRFLPTDLISEIHSYLEILALDITSSSDISGRKARDSKMAHLNRCRWIFSALFLTGMRISELASLKMGAVVCDRRRGQKKWWIEVTGKGNKERIIPLTDEFLEEFKLYRKTLGLPPHVDEGIDSSSPFVVSIQKERSGKSMSRSSIHRIVKEISKETSEYIRSLGRVEDANNLDKMSAHWLRHSYATALADSDADLRTIQENLGHANIQTSSIYLHANDDRRHKDAQGIKLAKQ